MFNKISIFFILMVSSILFGGCKKEEECGCKGEDETKITNDVGVIYKSSEGDLLISASNGLSLLCNLPQDVTEQKILFTGNTQSTCRKKLDSDIELNYVSISEYETFTDEGIRIGDSYLTVIRSEDYGDPAGYGYKVESVDMNIIQTTIPAVGGLTPFATPEEALRIGLLVLSKMKSAGFPTVTVDELKLLGII